MSQVGLKLSRHPLWQLRRLDVQIEIFTASFRATSVFTSQVAGLDRLKLSYKQFFPSPFLQTERAEMQFTDLLTTIGSWPQVEFFS